MSAPRRLDTTVVETPRRHISGEFPIGTHRALPAVPSLLPASAGASGPRRYASREMPAIRMPMPTRGELEEACEASEVHIALDLEAIPSSRAGAPGGQMVRFTPKPMAAVPAPAAEAEPEAMSSPAGLPAPARALDPRPGLVAFAGFGFAPTRLGETPAYALHVLARRTKMRRDLEVARQHRPRDVEIYEAALATADEAAVTKGLALISASVVGVIGALVSLVAYLF